MRSDFVTVRLSQFGAQRTGEGELIVVSGQREYRFKAGEQRSDITRAFDWERVLAHEHIDGQPLFEIVEESATAAPVAPRKVKAAGKEN